MASLKKRGSTYYAQYYIGKKQKRVNLHTSKLQVAKEELRKIESSLFQEIDFHLPTRTPLTQVLEEYVGYLYTVKTERNALKIVSYLRQIFGPICPSLELKNEKISRKAVKRQAIREIPPIECGFFELITTCDIARFIESVVKSKGIKGTTANRYREILARLYNWAMSQRGIVLPAGKNPAAQVERYKEDDPQITFLRLQDIDVQLAMLEEHPMLQVMVATYIYAGLRREEAVWLTKSDVDLTAGAHGVIRVRAKTVNGENWKPKTGKNRVVPISSQLRAYIDRYAPADSDGDWFFPSTTGTRIDPDNFSEDLRDANKEKGLSWSCADYRHTFGSQLAMKGESLFKISKLMGNSPEICRKHYAALAPESLMDSVEFPSLTAEAPPASPGAGMTPEPRPKSGEPRLRLVVNNR